MKSTGTPQTCKKLLLYSNMILQLKLPPSFPRVSMKARELYLKILLNTGLPWWSSVKTLPANAGDMSSTPGLERSHIPYPRAAKPACHNSCSHVPTAHAPHHKKPPQPEAQAPQQRVAPTCCIWGEGNGTPLQYCCLENPMDRGAWWAAVHGVAKSQTRLSDFPFAFHFHTLEKEMATHSSVLAWRIPGTGEPGGLPSVGLHRVRHDWSDSRCT